MIDLTEIAESEAQARWVVANHVGNGTERERCVICDTWWPCDLVSLAALAVRLSKQLKIATDQLEAFSKQRQERYPGEMGTFADDALIQISVEE